MNLAYENVKEVDGLDVSKEGTDAWEAAIKRYRKQVQNLVPQNVKNEVFFPFTIDIWQTMKKYYLYCLLKTMS